MTQKGVIMDCLLCRAPETFVVESRTAAELLLLWEEFGVHFSDDAVAAIKATTSVELRQCTRCHFRFCDAALAGNGAFYADLQRGIGSYYSPTRPEFHWTLRSANRVRTKTILDVGCGTGAFLDRARSGGVESSGLELNPSAVRECQGKGHKVFCATTTDFARAHPEERFDLVTAFQVLEHVRDPVAFFDSLVELTKPLGHIAIAVPNESGIGRFCGLDPHRWPPHHITRWRAVDLLMLARQCRCSVVETQADRLLGNQIDHFFALQETLSRRIRVKPPLLRGFPRPLISFLYSKIGLKYIFPRWGATLYALYQRHP